MQRCDTRGAVVILCVNVEHTLHVLHLCKSIYEYSSKDYITMILKRLLNSSD